jgi:methyl-accepting chemotaxis protein
MLENLSIGKKLMLSFGVLLLFGAIIGYSGYDGLNKTNAQVKEIGEVRLPSIEGLLTMSSAQTAVIVGERGLINRRMMDRDVRQAQYDYIEKAWSNADAGWKKYEPLPQTPEEAIMWKEFVPAWEKWKKESAKVVELSKEKDRLIKQGYSLNDDRITQLDQQTMDQSFAQRACF